MKTFTVIIIFLFQVCISQAQVRYGIRTAIGVDNLHVLYRGFGNGISVATYGYKPNEIKVTCNNCDTIYGENGHYRVKPGQGNSIIFYIHSLKKINKGKTIDSLIYRVHEIPHPSIKLAGRNSGDTLTPAYFRSGGYLLPVIGNLDVCIYVVIKSFTVVFNDNGSFYEKDITGNYIPKEVIEKILAQPNGTKIRFENIHIPMFDGTTRMLEAHYYLKK